MKLRIAMFYHSLVSDWNHGNAHFLRGVATELLDRGHEVVVYEPVNAWSVENLIRDHGEKPLADFRHAFPHLDSVRYFDLDLDQVLDGAGVLAYGKVIRDIYLSRGWAKNAWVWHEAADVRVFHPRPHDIPDGDVVWIGNWGDDERSAELREFLIDPVRDLRLTARAYGVRY